MDKNLQIFQKEIEYTFSFIFKSIGLNYRFVKDYRQIRKNDVLFIYSNLEPTEHDLLTLREKRNIFYVPADSDFYNTEKYSHSNISSLIRKIKLRREFAIISKRNLKDIASVCKADEVFLGKFHFDIIGNIFFALNETEFSKTDKNTLDNHLRLPDNYSHLSDYFEFPYINFMLKMIEDFLQESLISNDGFVLKKEMWPNKEDFALAISHNIDRLIKWDVKTFFGSLFLEMKLFFTLQWKQYFYIVFSKIKYIFTNIEPYWNFYTIREIEKKHKIASTFFCGVKPENKKKDIDYDITDNDLLMELRDLKTEKCEISLLGSYNSHKDFILAEQIKELQNIDGEKIYGIRQSLYRYDYNSTPEQHSQLEMLYDSSKSLLETPGFKNGIALPYKIFRRESEIGNEHNFWEIPVGFNDECLIKNKGNTVSIEKAKYILKNLLDVTEKNSCLLVINLSVKSFFDIPYLVQLFDFFLDTAVRKKVFTARLRDVAEWWENRESVKFEEFSNQINIHFPHDMENFTVSVLGKAVITEVEGIDAIFKQNVISFRKIKKNSNAIIKLEIQNRHEENSNTDKVS